jgi:site-specific DNA-methyltransferase (cytosine-N4-specific)
MVDLTTVKNLVRKPELDFKSVKASEGRHAIHNYPAMLHYRLVQSVLEKLGGSVLYDPFCGSGVVLVEGLKKGMKVFGTDINPVALLISEVRCSDLLPFDIERVLKSIYLARPEVPEVKNIDYWFKPKAVEELGKIRSAIKEFREEPFYKLLLVAFSQTVRDASNNRKGEFKRYRMSKEELSKFSPKPIKTFEERLRTYYSLIFSDPIKNKKRHIFLHNLFEPLNATFFYTTFLNLCP